MKILYKAGLVVLPGILCLTSMAQDTTAWKKDSAVVKKYHPVDINLQVRTLYVWRGFKVSNTPITDVDMFYISSNGSFKVGLWGGAGLTGDYKEFDYYASYTKLGFTFSLWDINNFSNADTAGLFDYRRATTSHIIDATIGYQFKDPFPLSINWSTIIQGRDTYVKANGNLANVYSNYVVLDYKLWKEADVDLHVFAGGGFAFGREKNFYGSKPNIVNAGIIINKELVVFNYHLPISATAMFSPEHTQGALQLVVNLF